MQQAKQHTGHQIFDVYATTLKNKSIFVHELFQKAIILVDLMILCDIGIATSTNVWFFPSEIVDRSLDVKRRLPTKTPHREDVMSIPPATSNQNLIETNQTKTKTHF